MNVISWNVNGLRAVLKRGDFDWIVNASPDIFCFQETKCMSEQLPQEIVNIPGYFSYFSWPKHKKGYSGVAIYSKVEPLKVEYGLGSSNGHDDEGRMITAYFKDFVLINCYFPNGGGGPERLKFKLEFYDLFLAYIEKLRKAGHHVIFCGDVNTAHHEVDLARPKENEKNTGFLPIEREWIDEVVSKGYVDIFRHMHPNATGAYTYWDMKTFARSRNVGWRIDYFFVHQSFAKKVTGAKIMAQVMGSDHCPIELSFKV